MLSWNRNLNDPIILSRRGTAELAAEQFCLELSWITVYHKIILSEKKRFYSQEFSRSIEIHNNFPLKKFNDGFNQQIPDFRHFAKTEGMHVNEYTPWENFSVEINDHQT